MDAHASFSRPVSRRALRNGPRLRRSPPGEVHKEGRKVAVREQPFPVLAALLERLER